MKKMIVTAVVVGALAVTGVSAIATSKTFNKPKVSFSQEQREILTEKIKVDLEEMLKAEEITQEQYDEVIEKIEKGGFKAPAMGMHPMGKPDKKFEMTEEKKTEMTAKFKEDLAQKLEKGEITREEYEERINAIENGEFKGFGRGPAMGMPPKGERPEITEEQKAEMTAKFKEHIAAKLEKGEITQEKYDEMITAVENGEFKGFGRGFGMGNRGGFKNGNPNGERNAKKDGMKNFKQKKAE